MVSSPFTEVVYSQDRIPVPLRTCSELNLGLENVNYSEEDLKSSLCPDLNAEFKFGGSYSKREEIGQLDFFLAPCKPLAPGDCEVLYNGTPTSTVTSGEIASEYFRDYQLEV